MKNLNIIWLAWFLFTACLAAQDVPGVSDDNYHLRGSLTNSKLVFEATKKGHVAFIGGSITEMNGYRPMVSSYLQGKFPATQFTFTNAGISSTCSTTGSHRLGRDVLSKGPVDLIFVEFAVNDDQDAGHDFAHAVRGMEGIIVQVRKHNPKADIVVTHFANTGMMSTLRKGDTPISMAAHNAVCKQHDISTNDLCTEITQLIDAGKTTWQLYGGVHPKPYGNSICTSMITRLLEKGWAHPATKLKAHAVVNDKLDMKSYVDGRLVDPDKAEYDKGWHYSAPLWKEIKGGFRTRYGGAPLLHGDKVGSQFTFAFTGMSVGAFVLAGPDAGAVEVKVDDGPWQTVHLYHRHSRGLHYPRTVMFAEELSEGAHVLTLRISKVSDAQSEGSAIRIMAFAVN